MKDFILPDIGEGIVECELVEWLVAEGERIEEDQPVADVMTDKALVQIPAMHSGVVRKLYYQKGDIAKVHAPLFAMDIDGEAPAMPAQDAEEPVQVAKTATAATGASHVEDFVLPDIGEGIVECELVEWLVSEGEVIEEDQPVADVMTDKALVQIPSKFSGQVVKLYYQKGEIAKVHTPLFAIEVKTDGQAGDSAVSHAPQTAKTPVSAIAAPVKSCMAKNIPTTTDKFTGGEHEPKLVNPDKPLASPAVRRLARELEINLSQVQGSGKKGRVMKQDLLSQGQAAEPVANQEAKAQTVQTISGGTRTEAIRGIKAAMAKQMSASVFSIPHFSVSDEIEMDALMAARAALKPEFEKQGVKLSFMPFIIKAMSLALKQFPIVNSQVNEDCTELTYFDDHNIGMAVDSKIGLLVPNIKGVQNLSLFEVAKEASRLIDLAREGKLGSSDLKGGTISISNVGVIGGTTATPVINKPESAIVALGKIQRLPRFDEQDNVKAVNIMHISWSGDHRIIDGATMVRFSNLWKSYLENPLSMLTEMK
ncbi:dihydrolipoyllysine-residue acetyltransferase [Bowmanella yangjiangensis]|uniref:Dihydrolipoamide acetyltransferase component of pyruvate dehydrogenase complex n=1 Tax=Bowmanella yangjiangensis TaxID=2811230 RepID=A0ABS3CX63_9ALTE|nr:dihydrolipoyllysine-residue acetyltransferase [Bowmanella yangjiangensis]MBN7821114.1 dihydrolipoyllysine-residue acetyltransferase [Bowmanella yangjiangensis]